MKIVGPSGGDPTEAALLVVAQKVGLNKGTLERCFPRVREIPFSSDRKMMSTVHRDRNHDGDYVVWSKGAPDVLLERCGFEFLAGEERKLTDAHRATLRCLNARLAEEALRTLAVAFRKLPCLCDWQHCDCDELERELTFVGLVGMIDPARPEAIDAVRRLREAGIRPIMIT